MGKELYVAGFVEKLSVATPLLRNGLQTCIAVLLIVRNWTI